MICNSCWVLHWFAGCMFHLNLFSSLHHVHLQLSPWIYPLFKYQILPIKKILWCLCHHCHRNHRHHHRHQENIIILSNLLFHDRSLETFGQICICSTSLYLPVRNKFQIVLWKKYQIILWNKYQIVACKRYQILVTISLFNCQQFLVHFNLTQRCVSLLWWWWSAWQWRWRWWWRWRWRWWWRWRCWSPPVHSLWGTQLVSLQRPLQPQPHQQQRLSFDDDDDYDCQYQDADDDNDYQFQYHDDDSNDDNDSLQAKRPQLQRRQHCRLSICSYFVYAASRLPR